MKFPIWTTFIRTSCHWHPSPKMPKSLIRNQVMSKVSVYFLPPLTRQSTSVQLHQGRLLWVTLSSGSVINNCLRPNLPPSLPLQVTLDAAPPPQDGDSPKQRKTRPATWQLLCLGDTKPVTSSAEGQRVCEGQMSWNALHHSPLIW